MLATSRHTVTQLDWKKISSLTTDCLLCEMETVVTVIDIFSQLESYGFLSSYSDKRVKVHPFVDRKYFTDLTILRSSRSDDIKQQFKILINIKLNNTRKQCRITGDGPTLRDWTRIPRFLKPVKLFNRYGHHLEFYCSKSIQWNLDNTTTFGSWKIVRINGVVVLKGFFT